MLISYTFTLLIFSIITLLTSTENAEDPENTFNLREKTVSLKNAKVAYEKLNSTLEYFDEINASDKEEFWEQIFNVG